MAVLDAYRRGLDRLGQAYEVIEADDLRTHRHRLLSQGPVHPGTLLVQPSALVKGLADSLPGNVSLYEHTPITAVEYGDRTLLSHPHGSILADRLVSPTTPSA